MKRYQDKILIKGKEYDAVLLQAEEKDRDTIKKLYKSWLDLKVGLKNFESRAPNLPEGISESAFSLEFNCPRVLKVKGSSGSFDCYDPKTHERLQIKSTTIKDDLTSFGPDSVWDVIYLLDFYRDGKFDGKFDVYKIPNDLIYNYKINKTQTFRDQQKQKRRPRFGLKKNIIRAHKIKPVRTCVIG